MARTPWWRAGARLLGAPLCLIALLFVSVGCDEKKEMVFLSKGPGGEGGSKFFTPSPDDIMVDQTTGLEVVKNVLNITFSPATDKAAIDRIIASVNGQIVGYDRAVNFYQVRIPGADYAAIQKIRMKLLADHKEVEMASNTPLSAKKNPYYVK